MLCIRLASPLLGILVLLAASEKSLVYAEEGITSLANHDQALKGNLELPNEAMKFASTVNKRLRGRKMGAVDEVKKENMKVKSTMSTGATPSDGKCGHGVKEKLDIEGELNSRALPCKAKLFGLIPFSSDYHVPKTHPPKNN